MYLPLRQNVEKSGNSGYEPRWSTDGTELFYLQGNAMMAVAVETEDAFSFAAPKLLFSGQYFTSLSANVHSYDVASDGRFLMIQAPGNGGTDAPGSASIVVVQNWTEELKQRVPSRQ